MRLDIKEAKKFASVLTLIAERLELYKKEIAFQKVRLQINSELQDVIFELSLTEKKMDEQTENIRKIKNAVKKICEAVIQCESDICDNIESTGSKCKQSFSYASEIKVDLNSVWRIE